jgi:hypothetical protein
MMARMIIVAVEELTIAQVGSEKRTNSVGRPCINPYFLATLIRIRWLSWAHFLGPCNQELDRAS